MRRSRARLALWVLVMLACRRAAPTGPEPRAGPPAVTPATTASGEPDAGNVATRCTKDLKAEAPIVLDQLGSGSRFIELINNGDVEIQVRLLGEDERPALTGTMRIPPHAQGRFNIEPGTYLLRYRDQERCLVYRGSAVGIGPGHAGVRIAIEAIFTSGEDHVTREVDEPL
jgi:hypothetical protein